MSQQAVKSRALVTTEEEPETPFRKTERPAPADVFSFPNYGWSFWNTVPAQFRKVSFPMMKSPDEIATMNKETIDALTKAGTILADGFQEMGRHVLALAHSSAEAHMTTGKDTFNVRSLKDMADLHSNWMRRLLNTTLAETIKLSELSVKIVNQVSEPIQTHISATFGKIDSLI